MSGKRKITFAKLKQLGPLSAIEAFQATLAPVEGAGYRIFLRRNETDYEVVSDDDLSQVYFPSFDQLVARLIESGAVCHLIIIDAVGLISSASSSKDHQSQSRSRLLLPPPRRGQTQPRAGG